MMQWRHRRSDVIERGGIQDGARRGIARGVVRGQPLFVRTDEEVANHNPQIERHRHHISDNSALYTRADR